MRKTFKYRIYPTKAQTTTLLRQLDQCRWLYNHLLEQRKVAYDQRAESLSLYDQQATFVALKDEHPALKQVHSQVLQNVAVRIDLGMKAFFRRVKAGEKPGYPRFRGKGRYNSLCYPQYGNGAKLTGLNGAQPQNLLYLSKVGNVKVVLHRPIEGEVKTVCIEVRSTGKWYVTISCELPAPPPLPISSQNTGIDVGLKEFAVLSDGRAIHNPRFFRVDEQQLAKLQHKRAKLEKGSPEHRKARKPVARLHERIGWRRSDFAHQNSRRIVNQYQVIAVEDLAVNRMVHNHCLAKSISDAAWSQFSDLLTYKAAWAGRQFVAVNPAYTSQNCSRCGHRQPMPLDVRVYECPDCKLVLDRDHNAALNILALGLQRLGIQSLDAPQFIAGE
jgi:putative transposase